MKPDPDRLWRLNNLYTITDKEGRKIPFGMNWAQEELYRDLHYQNVILKARQIGFTTFIQLLMLDACLFEDNVRAATIAHTLHDAQTIFRDKVKFAYDCLPDDIKARAPLVYANTQELMLANNSSVRVGTSLRSGTLQYLHVSEYGKLCAKFPEKAREVRTGALNTVQAGQTVFIESTAEGQEGHFYDICQTAQTQQRMGAELTPLDFKFFFFPWQRCPEYVLAPEGVVVGEDMLRCFQKLEDEHAISLTPEQRAWYARKAETQLEDMKREYPSTPDEAFEASVEGAYFAQQMAIAELQGRIGNFAPLDGFPVHTVWDLGVGDATAIWFFQVTPQGPRVVAYYENNGEGLPHYTHVLRKLERERDWTYGHHWLPHDAKVKEWGTGKPRVEQFMSEGFRPRLVPNETIEDGINAARHVIGLCKFDESGCAEGLKALRNYRKEWDDERGVWRDRPRHDWASHGADAYRYLSLAFRDYIPPPERQPGKMVKTPRGEVFLPDPPRVEFTLNDVWEDHERRRRRARI